MSPEPLLSMPRALAFLIFLAIPVLTIACGPGDRQATAPSPVATSQSGPLANRAQHDKMELENGVVATFRPCNPQGYVQRYHNVRLIYPADGSFAANTFGDPEFGRTRYLSGEGRQKLAEILADSELLARINERAPLPVRCPDDVVERLRGRFDAVPEANKYVIDEDTVAFFPPCDPSFEKAPVSPIEVESFPTGSKAVIENGGPGYEHRPFGTRSGHAHLDDALGDAEVMAEILEEAADFSRCVPD